MTDETARSESIGQHIEDIGGWRGETLGHMRSLVLAADPEMVEEIKWRKPSNPAGVIAWFHSGLIATGEVYKDKVKVTFAKGASLPDPTSFFNAGFGGGTRRAIDVFEGDEVDTDAFKSLVKAAVALNEA